MTFSIQTFPSVREHALEFESLQSSGSTSEGIGRRTAHSAEIRRPKLSDRNTELYHRYKDVRTPVFLPRPSRVSPIAGHYQQLDIIPPLLPFQQAGGDLNFMRSIQKLELRASPRYLSLLYKKLLSTLTHLRLPNSEISSPRCVPRSTQFKNNSTLEIKRPDYCISVSMLRWRKRWWENANCRRICKGDREIEEIAGGRETR